MKGKIEMKNIGKYNRVDCYECTQEEYEREYKRGLDSCIYIIDGVMVKNNLKIGYWDGELVKECRPVVYHYYPSRSNEKVSKDINFSDYSKVVDEFFRKLKL